MAQFKERMNAKPTVAVVEEKMPYIMVSAEAIAKMQVYVEECSDEIGWLGTATYDEYVNTYNIHDVFLFEQDVHSTTTEITPEGLENFATELLQRPDGMEVWNNMKVWGHSHVNMGITPSGQDNDQMKTFAGVGHEWFIRLIANKKGEMKLDLYNYKDGIAYFDVPWEVQLSEEEIAIQAQLDSLQAALDGVELKRISMHQTPIKEEMKEKVRKKTYATNYSQQGYGTGYYANGKWVSTSPTRTQVTPGSNWSKKNFEEDDSTQYVEGNLLGRYTEIDVYEDDHQVVTELGHQILLEINNCLSLAETEAILEDCGYYNYFTENDLARIYRVSKKYAQ